MAEERERESVWLRSKRESIWLRSEREYMVKERESVSICLGRQYDDLP